VEAGISSFVVDNRRQEHPVLPSEGEPEKKQKQDFMTKEAGWAVYGG
jgi:hypothetical protein